MTWKQFFRSIEVSQRRTQRENMRRQRQHVQRAAMSARDAATSARAEERRQKQWAKEEKWLQQSGEAAQFEQYMDALVSLHTEWGDAWDWQAVSQTAPPAPPHQDTTAQVSARMALENYQPGFIDRLSGTAKANRTRLEAELANAIAADTAKYEAAQLRHRQDHQVWENSMRLAPNVLRLNLQACKEALKHSGAFEEIEHFGTSVQLSNLDADVATLSILIQNDELVPREEIKMSAAGKLSTKAIATGRYWSVYQDHICSCALRVALETFAVVPVRRTIANIARTTLDPSTGHVVRPTIFAIHIAREDLERLNLDAIEPSAAMKNFPHRVAFKKTTGFSEVAPITADEQWASS